MTDRPKYLFLHAARRFRQPSIDRRLHIETVIQYVAELGNSTSRHQGCSLFARQPIIGEDFLAMPRRNQGPEVRGRFQRRSQAQTLGLEFQRAHESIRNLTFDIDSLRAQTNLARIEKHSLTDRIHGFLKVTVGEYDGRLLSAEFKRDGLYRRRDRLHDGSTGLRLASEGHNVHIGMFCQEFASRVWSEAMNYVIDAVRNSGLLHDLGEQGRGR